MFIPVGLGLGRFTSNDTFLNDKELDLLESGLSALKLLI